MRVVLTSSALECEGNLSLLSRILGFVEDGWHDVLVAEGARASWDRWIKRVGELGPIYRDAEQKSQKRQATLFSAAEVVIEEKPSRRGAMTLLEALRFLEQPFEIWVEDATSDKEFLDSVVPSAWREQWRILHERRALVFKHLGGVTHVERRLRADIGSVSDRRRCFIVIDSDSPYPWSSPDELPKNTQKALNAAREHNVGVYPLRRRMAENYLPIAALCSWASELSVHAKGERVRHIEAFERLSKERRHHHHLKVGIKNSEEDFYKDEKLAPEDLEALKQGLNRKGANCSNAFQHATEALLRKDGVHAELGPLFTKIFDLV